MVTDVRPATPLYHPIPARSESVSNELRTQYPARSVMTTKVMVSDNCSIMMQESGNPTGIPVLFVHGGPGIRFRSTDHQWFDPDKYRVFIIQQRGTYACNPSAENLKEHPKIFNDVTIETLAADLEIVRKHLNIDKWLVFGGSWGSTLSLFYAQQYPESCAGLILRGIFLASAQERNDYFNESEIRRKAGESWSPDALNRIVNYAKDKGFDVSSAQGLYFAYKCLVVDQNDLKAARIWTAFEDYIDDPKNPAQLNRVLNDNLETTPEERSIAVWETLMFNDIPDRIDLLDPARIAKLNGLSVKIVHGEGDNLCPIKNAQRLVDALQEAGSKVDFTPVRNGVHSAYNPAMMDALVKATDEFADQKD